MSTQIRVGTSSFTADGWNGAFYTKGMKSADYLRYYAGRFDTVEIDSTFYRCPTIEAVRNWALKTPPGFIFSLKIPRTITHEKVLVECDKEFEEFVGVAQALGEKMGPMVFQFPFFNDSVFTSPCSSCRGCKPSSRSCRAPVGVDVQSRSETNTG